MPGMDGYAMMEALRGRGDGTPAIAVTGFGRPVDVRRAMVAGFGEHLVKPMTLTALRQAISRVMATRGD